MVVKLYHPYTQLPHNVRLSHRRMATFLIIAPYRYSTYLLTDGKKLFRTVSPGVIKDCRCFFGISDTTLLIVKRKMKFLRKFGK